jgi:hypothetical protein
MMGQRQHTIGRVRRFFKIHVRKLICHGFPQQAVFPHGESMPRRKRQYKTITVKSFQNLINIRKVLGIQTPSFT